MAAGRRNSYEELPAGFRFHPTDEELIMFYLRNQATSKPCPANIIPEVDIYKFDPWDLPEKTQEMKEKEWYFFTPRDRKYPNGVRPNRAAVSGYWKATGTDKSIYSASKYVGIKKALVFYKGKPPKGIKTDWIMHEYRLSKSTSSQPSTSTATINTSMRLDDWVLCRIYKKKNNGKGMNIKIEEQRVDENVKDKLVINENQQQAPFKIPRQCSLSHLWEIEYMESMSNHLFADNSYHTNFGQQNNVVKGNIVIPHQQGEVPNQSSLLNQQHLYMNHEFNLQ